MAVITITKKTQCWTAIAAVLRKMGLAYRLVGIGISTGANDPYVFTVEFDDEGEATVAKIALDGVTLYPGVV